VAHGDYFSTANRRTKIPAIFSSDIWYFLGVLKCLSIYSMISLGILNGVLRNRSQETLISQLGSSIPHLSFMEEALK